MTCPRGRGYYLPPLTTVRQDFSELGRRALAALVERISGKTGGHVRVPPELVLRASAAPPAAVLRRTAT